jgi:hypothetical protein
MSISVHAITQTSERIFMTFYIAEFSWNLLTHSNYCCIRTSIIDTLHKDLRAFLRADVTGWGISATGNRGILGDDVITQLDSPLTQSSLPQTAMASLARLTTVYSGECTNSATPCIHFLTCWLTWFLSGSSVRTFTAANTVPKGVVGYDLEPAPSVSHPFNLFP